VREQLHPYSGFLRPAEAFSRRAARVGRNWRRPARPVSQDNMATNGSCSRVSSVSDCKMLVMDGPFNHRAPWMEELSIELVASVPEVRTAGPSREQQSWRLRDISWLFDHEDAQHPVTHQIHGRSGAPTKGGSTCVRR
jgi:hypothetical protein